MIWIMQINTSFDINVRLKLVAKDIVGEHVREGEDIDETELPPNYIE